MQLGDSVNGLMMNRHWRFVTGDTHKVAEAVNAHDSAARLVAHDESQQISVARFVERRHLGEDDIEVGVGAPVSDPGGAFMLVFYPKGADGRPMHGEPDMTVVDQLRKRDLWARQRGVNARDQLRQFEALDREREEKAAERLMEKITAQTEQSLFGWARGQRRPWAPNRIYVPGRD